MRFLNNNYDMTSYFAFFSFSSGGWALRALSPILVPCMCPTRDMTSPVASFFPLFSIKDRSACNTRFEFWNKKIQSLWLMTW